MASKVDTLYEICLNEIARILIRNCRSRDNRPNPFETCHSNTVEDLISTICTKTGNLYESYPIHFLVRSGRVKHFKLHGLVLSLSESADIFRDLMPWSMKLKSIEIDVHSFVGQFIPYCYRNLLRSAKALVHLESSIKFHFSDISESIHLLKLILNFYLCEAWISYTFVDSFATASHSVRSVSIPLLQIHDRSDYQIARLLLYCPELVEIDYEVTRCIKLLHEKKAATRYKLRKATLGNVIGATSREIRLTSTYCPDLREVKVYPVDRSAIHALSYFRHITVLTLNEPSVWGNEYSLVILPLLEISHFGHNLKSLKLVGYSGVNCASIGACCPNLEELRLESISEDRGFEPSRHSFKKLISLYLEVENYAPCNAATLVGILSSATGLGFLTITNASMLTDSLLNTILKNAAAFTNVRAMTISHCGLSINGLRELAKRLYFVKYIKATSSTISLEEAEVVLKTLDLKYLSWKPL